MDRPIDPHDRWLAHAETEYLTMCSVSVVLLCDNRIWQVSERWKCDTMQTSGEPINHLAAMEMLHPWVFCFFFICSKFTRTLKCSRLQWTQIRIQSMFCIEQSIFSVWFFFSCLKGVSCHICIFFFCGLLVPTFFLFSLWFWIASSLAHSLCLTFLTALRVWNAVTENKYLESLKKKKINRSFDLHVKYAKANQFLNITYMIIYDDTFGGAATSGGHRGGKPV